MSNPEEVIADLEAQKKHKLKQKVDDLSECFCILVYQMNEFKKKLDDVKKAAREN